MNILQRIQYKMGELKTLNNALRGLMNDKKFLITFHDHRDVPEISVHKHGDRDCEVRCVMAGPKLVAISDDPLSEELLDIIDYINKEVASCE